MTDSDATQNLPEIEANLNRNVQADAETKLLSNVNSEPLTPSKQAIYDRQITAEINQLLRDTPLTEDTTCGFWFFRGKFFQRFATPTAYVVLYGIVGGIFSIKFAYFNGTLTTMEKRFKIPSKNIGIITVGNDVSQVLVSAVLSYYAGKGHRPRWIGFGILTLVVFCVLTALPHFLYGPGDDALALTAEFGMQSSDNAATFDDIEMQRSKNLCRINNADDKCRLDEGNFTPQVILFVAQLISGIGGSLFHSLGVSYMDDNTKKSRTASFLSFSYFLQLLGPALGFTLASYCIRIYISPQLRPLINDKDPRWLGAWWLGWLILGGMLLVSAILLAMFPKELPRVVARRKLEEDRKKQHLLSMKNDCEKAKLNGELDGETTKASFKDMLKTFKRLITNKTLMCNNLSSVFYFFGFAPYWVFLPKYIEIQYRVSSAQSNMISGPVPYVFSAVGILLAGVMLSKYKPRARIMAAWNVIVGFLTVASIIAYASIGCAGNEKSVIVNIPTDAIATCNSACYCDYVSYSPVCGEDNMTYISPCHAGCRKQRLTANGEKIFYNCDCIPRTINSTVMIPYERPLNSSLGLTAKYISVPSKNIYGGQATPRSCPVDCSSELKLFVAVMYFLQFIGASGRASNFLVAVRCVPEIDKAAAMGVGMMMLSLLAFIPSPIFFGRLIDRTCLVWGKTCTTTGNCWLYDPESLRYMLNITAAVFVTIGSLFDCGVWYYVKNLKIFDVAVQEVELQAIPISEDNISNENEKSNELN